MEKWIWKWIILITVLLFVFGMTSVGLAQTKYMEKLKGTKLSILVVEMAQIKPYWKLIPEFEKKYGIKVEVDEVPFDQNREKTLLDMSKHTGRYDVFTVDCMWLAEYAAAKYLEPVAKYIKNPDLTEADFDVGDFIPRIYSGTGVWEDIIYNIPIGSGTMTQLWRKDLVAEYGLKFPERWSEWTYKKMAEYLPKLHHPEKGYSGFVTQPRRFEWGWNLTQLLYTWMPPSKVGDEFFDKNWKITINNPISLEALKFYLSWRPYMPEGSANYGYDEVLITYRSGKAAGCVTYTEWIGNHFESAAESKVAGKNAWLHTPVGPYGRIDPFFGSWGLSISIDSKNKEAAWVFLQWLCSKSNQMKLIQAGVDPVRHSGYRSPDLVKYMPWYVPMYEHQLHFTNPDERPRIPEWAAISETMGLYGNKAWTNEITPEEALKTMEKDMTKVMKSGGYYDPKMKKPIQTWRDLTYYDLPAYQWK